MASRQDQVSVLEPAASGADATLASFSLGQRVRDIRKGNGWTLEEVSQRTGLARSTLSKIENDQMSPTYEAVQKLAKGLGLDLPQLFQPSRAKRTFGRRTLTRAGEGRAHPTATYQHELLCTDLTQKKMVPFKSSIKARDFSEFSDWVRHEGEEFLLVLSGRILLLTEFYEAVALETGDSAYFDSAMGHALISDGEADAEVLWVCCA